MNANQILNMVLRIVMRKAINKGIGAGIDKVAGKGKPSRDMTPEERQQAQAAKDTTKRAKHTNRIFRRFGWF